MATLSAPPAIEPISPTETQNPTMIVSSASSTQLSAGSSAGLAGPSGSLTSISTAQRESAPKRKFNRLQGEAIPMMQKYFDNSPNLNKAQRTAILAELHKIPGHEGFTHKSLETMWTNKRKKLKERTAAAAAAAGQLTSLRQQWLDETQISNLRDLLNGNPNPDEATVQRWADTMLRVDTNEVRTWIQREIAERAARRAAETNPNPEYQPPTPAGSTSPEPMFDVKFDQYDARDSMDVDDMKPSVSSPIFSSHSIASPVSSSFTSPEPASTSFPSYSPIISNFQSPPPPSVNPYQTTEFLSRIAANLHAPNPIFDAPPPRNLKELNQRLALMEDMMHQLLRKLGSPSS
ncbi:hypothetical protein C8J56DRAFT_341952 [Mycena floridula]|nr:hypothetical protein C8J56DRAFT_341952 [Mycena floridula]